MTLARTIVAHALSTDLRRAVATAERIGASGVLLDPTVFRDLNTDSRTAEREITHLLGRARQPAAAIDLKLSGFDPRPARDPRGPIDLERDLDALDRCLRIARGLSCPLVTVDLGPLPAAPDEPASPAAIDPSLLGALILPDAPKKPAPRPAAPIDPAFVASVDQFLREAGRLADRASRLVAFRASLASVASLAVALKAADCPWFGVDLDPLALLADEDADAFARVASSVRHVRVRDGRRGAMGRVQPTAIGAGQVDFGELLSNLRDADYRGPLCVDPTDLADRATAAADGVTFVTRALSS